MSNGLLDNINAPTAQDRPLNFKYESEDAQFFIVSDINGVRVNVPKNRAVPGSFIDPRSESLTPAFLLLALAFLGLAPAGLCTLILSPLAALWALVILVTSPLSRSRTIRVVIVWGISAGLLGIAIILSRLFFAQIL